MMPADAEPLDPATDDLWAIVGAPRTATKQELRRAYRRKARTLHPDISTDPDATAKFRRLVLAFETLMDDSRRSLFETSRKRSSARERANAQWEAATSGSRWGPDAASPKQRPAGSRREAEAQTKEESEKRRERWREIQFDTIFREHMPLEYSASSAQRAAFLAAMETAVQSFVRREGSAPSSGARAETRGGAWSGGRDVGSLEEEAELMELLKLRNREVLRAELGDAKHRSSKHRERVRWLENELQAATQKAEIWKGATPASEADRVQAMERELAFLELSNRLRTRLGEQRTMAARVRAREKAIETRLATLRDGG